MTSNSQTTALLPDSAVKEHTLKEIKRTPKMKQQIAARVARNLDELLEELKSCGVFMHAVCREVPLGDPDDRDSKALFNYRNPEGSKPRKYVTKPALYFDIAEAISRIPGHPLTGSTGEILRLVFEGTPYAPVRSSSESVAIRLKMILDSNVEKISQHIDLPSIFQKLAGIRQRSQETLHAEDLYHAAIKEEEYTLSIPQLELGYIYDFLQDDCGHHLQLKTENDGTFWLAAQRQVSLFIGLDDDAVPRPFVALKTKKGLYAKQGQKSVSLDRYQDAPRVAGIMFYGPGNKQFLLDEEFFTRSVTDKMWRSDYEFDKSVYGLAFKEYAPIHYEEWWKHHEDGDEYMGYIFPDFERHYSDWNEFEFDRSVEHLRGPARNDQKSQMFLNSNPSFNSKYVDGKDRVTVKPISVDVLEEVGANIDSFGLLALGGEGGTLNVPDKTPLLFGDSALGKLMGWFTGSATLSLELEQTLRELVGEDLEGSKYAPPNGWYKANLESGCWSASDLLWLRTKIFATRIDSLFEATRPQKQQYEQYIKWLGNR